MTFRKYLLLAVAASGLTGAFAAEASAGKPFFLFRPFLPGYNDSYPPPDGVYYMTEEQYYRYLKRQRRKERIMEDYYARQDEAAYYDDEEYLPPPKKKVRKKQAAKPVVKKRTANAVAKPKPAAKKTVAAAKTSKPAPASKPQPALTTASISKAPATASASSKGMSCSKAADIVAGYGFDSVKAGTCSGDVFSFNAVRSGKSYVVKVNSASGELTEVRKL